MSAPETFALPDPEPVGDFDNANPNICPACASRENLKISIPLWIDLLPDGAAIADEQDYVWENSDPCQCGTCDWHGVVGDTLLSTPVALTLPQSNALWAVYRRDNWKPNKTFADFLASVTMGPGCVMVPWAGLHLGIEPDGYTHS
jgi:hypothetical protein